MGPLHFVRSVVLRDYKYEVLSLASHTQIANDILTGLLLLRMRCLVLACKHVLESEFPDQETIAACIPDWLDGRKILYSICNSVPQDA
jgi:hypothetical protein